MLLGYKNLGRHEPLTGLAEKIIYKYVVTMDLSPKTIELRANKIQ